MFALHFVEKYNTNKKEFRAMIINEDDYECPQCGELYFFDTSQPYTAECPKCKCSLEFLGNSDCDTELAEKVKNTPPYDPFSDPQNPFYMGKPVVECPYCHSTSTRKLSGFAKLGTMSWGATPKEWHCNRCNSDF